MNSGAPALQTVGGVVQASVQSALDLSSLQTCGQLAIDAVGDVAFPRLTQADLFTFFGTGNLSLPLLTNVLRMGIGGGATVDLATLATYPFTGWSPDLPRA
jgi:hypothetical protein